MIEVVQPFIKEGGFAALVVILILRDFLREKQSRAINKEREDKSRDIDIIQSEKTREVDIARENRMNARVDALQDRLTRILEEHVTQSTKVIQENTTTLHDNAKVISRMMDFMLTMQQTIQQLVNTKNA